MEGMVGGRGPGGEKGGEGGRRGEKVGEGERRVEKGGGEGGKGGKARGGRRSSGDKPLQFRPPAVHVHPQHPGTPRKGRPLETPARSRRPFWGFGLPRDMHLPQKEGLQVRTPRIRHQQKAKSWVQRGSMC